MRITIRTLVICLAVLLPLVAAALEPRLLCPTCQRYVDKSPQGCYARILLGGKHPKSVGACSLFCLFERLEDFKSKPEVITIVSYPTFHEDIVQRINVTQAVFLYDAKADGNEDLCHEPYIYAFPDEQLAKDAQAKLGGELLKWDAVQERCEKLAADWEPDTPDEEPSPIPHRSH